MNTRHDRIRATLAVPAMAAFRARSAARLAAVAVALAIPLGGCGSTPIEPTSQRFDMTTSDGRPAVLLVADRAEWPHDAYDFLGMRLSGDILEVSVRYGGGCERHEFALLVTPVFLESYPVQMNGSLAHDAHDDPCDALVETSLRLDLSPVRVAYQNAYARTSDTIILHIADWPDPIRYSF